MKNLIYRLFLILGVTVLATACGDDDNYGPGPQSQGAFFPAGTNTTYVDIFPGDTQRSFTIARSNSQGAATVDLEVDDPAGIFHFPASVSFADGESTVDFNVTFDFDDLDFVDYTVIVKIPDDQAYLYGTPALSLTLGMDESLRWEPLEEKAMYYDGYFSSLFSLPIYNWEVAVEKKVGSSGNYRLVNPYSEWPMIGAADYDPDRVWYLEINADDPEGVYIPLCESGIDLGYGPTSLWSMASYYMDRGNSFAAVKANGFCGKLENGVITFPNKGLCLVMDGLYQANANNGFRLELPASER